MIYFILAYCVLYSVSIVFLVFFGFFRQVKKESSYQMKNTIKINELSVIIPFRNEALRLEGLIKSIKNSNSLPGEIIFVDDHSLDDGAEIIEMELRNFPIKIIQMPEGLEGKKKAIRFGMKQGNGKYILTIDADVYFNDNFFDKIESLEIAEMYVRPAIMKASIFLEYLYEIDLALVNAVNIGISGWKRPIMASGANLLFNAQVFNEIDSIDNHQQVASGDDMYTLKDFRTNGKSVRLVSNLEHAIYTETPQSFGEFLNQRLRWLGKTNDLKDNLSTTLAVTQSLLTFTLFILITACFWNGKYELLLQLLMFKTIIDLMVFYPYLNRIKRLKTWLFIPLYELLFPFYTLIILVGIFTYKPKWKGRTVKHK